MKRLRVLVLTFLLALHSLLLVSTTANAEANLIANPSVEAASGDNPASWQSNAWGTNSASFSYKSDGYTGARSLYVNLSSRTSGDAKWMHTAATVDANTEYTYTSWYKSSVATEIDLQYQKADGSYSYAYVRSVPAAESWTQLNATFTTPADATRVTVMHIIYNAGWLQTDDFSLSKAGDDEPTDPTPTDPTPVDSDNLIANSSFETANGSAPANWAKNSWGTNSSSFSYEPTGHTGSRSATTRMTAHTSGDAKWYASPVSVVANKSYTYNDYYKSDIATRVVAAYISTSGVYTYQELASTPASSVWKKYTATLTIPAGVNKVSIYHVVDTVGFLTIDDASLSVAVPSSTSSLISNASLETAIANAPADWNKSQWGTNTPTFTYATDGHDSARSAKITMSNYVSGDAKWYFNPIELTAGQQYRFTTWYKGNVVPHAVAMFLMADGSEQYFGMPLPQGTPSTTTWQKYSDTFSVPEGAAKVSVFMFINQNGWIQTDDYSIDSYHPNGFNRPLLTLTFDDGHEDNTATALPLMEQYGYKSTQCYATSFIEGYSQTVINGVMAFKNKGHEICSHTVTHPFLTQLGVAQLDYELSHSQAYLRQLTGAPVNNFASPYGDYNAQVNTAIKKYYSSHRSVDEGYNSKDNFDIYNIRVQNVLDTTTASEVESWVANAQADKTWLVLVYHRVATNPGPYDTTPSLFAAQLQKIAASGITVKTTQAALDEVLPQL